MILDSLDMEIQGYWHTFSALRGFEFLRNIWAKFMAILHTNEHHSMNITQRTPLSTGEKVTITAKGKEKRKGGGNTRKESRRANLDTSFGGAIIGSPRPESRKRRRSKLARKYGRLSGLLWITQKDYKPTLTCAHRIAENRDYRMWRRWQWVYRTRGPVLPNSLQLDLLNKFA